VRDQGAAHRILTPVLLQFLQLKLDNEFSTLPLLNLMVTLRISFCR